MKSKDMKIGDLVKIIDGSYAVRVDRFEPCCGIGLCTELFEVLSMKPSSRLTNGLGDCKVHNIFIKNTVTGAIYLHSAAFVSLIKRPVGCYCKCCCCK